MGLLLVIAGIIALYMTVASIVEGKTPPNPTSSNRKQKEPYE